MTIPEIMKQTNIWHTMNSTWPKQILYPVKKNYFKNFLNFILNWTLFYAK